MSTLDPEYVKQIGTILVAVIGTLGAVWTKNRMRPSRTEGVYDGYERFIKQLVADNERRQGQVDQLQAMLDKQRQHTEEAQDIINRLREELRQTRERNEFLMDKLDDLKQQPNS